MPENETVHGRILLPESHVPGIAAKILVQIEDVSRADAPSRVVGEEQLDNVSLSEGGSLSFRITVPASTVEERNSYSVRAHVDVSGSGTIESGDFISTQSYPVLTRGYGNEAVIRVKRV